MKLALEKVGPRPTVAALVWRHRRMMSLVMLAGLVGTLTYYSTAQREFRSEAKIFVGLGREAIVANPTNGPTQLVTSADAHDAEVHAVEELLKSRALLEKVVERFELDTKKKSRSAVRAWVRDRLTLLDAYNLNPVQVYSRRDKAIGEVATALKVSSGSKTNVVSLSYLCEEPRLAQQILEHLTVLARQEYLRLHRPRGSHQFFKSQSELLKRELDTAAKMLRDAKNQSHVVSIPVEQQALQTQLTRTEADALATEATLASTTASIERIRKSLNELPEQLTTAKTVGMPNVAGDSMQHELFKLKVSVTDLAAKLSDEHPLVQTSREQIRRLEDQLSKQPVDRTQTTTGVNTSRQTLDLDLRKQEALADSLRAKSKVLTAQYAALQDRLNKLNEHEVRVNDLERRTQIAAATYRSYVEHLEQARIDQQLQEAKISSLTLLEPPTLSETPVSPRLVPTVSVGLILSAMCSVALALAVERRRYRRTIAAPAPLAVAEPRASSAHPPSRRDVRHEHAIS